MFIVHKNDLTSQHNLPLIQFDNKKFVAKDNDTFRLFNNICPHQGSLIVKNQSPLIKCHYHGWQWNTSGDPISNGSTKICNNSNLRYKTLSAEHNLIFTEPIDLDIVKDINLSHMSLVEKRTDLVVANYTTITDVFLDVDHIPIAHQGVYDSIGISGSPDVHWNYYNWGSIQLVEKSVDYNGDFKTTLLDISEEKLSAFWIAVYPYTMIEWQPGAMFITVCSPKENKTNVSVFKYRDLRYNDLNWKINSNMWETAWSQDKDLAEGIVNINSKFFEDSKLHFRQWLKNNELRF
jgi:phenylpropionate dioxygenase-like ring-hydroxylating dioxygenase large terminal subunit